MSTISPVTLRTMFEPACAGSSLLADQTKVLSGILSNTVPTRYFPSMIWWNPKANSPEDDGQFLFDPARIDEPNSNSVGLGVTVKKTEKHRERKM